MVLHTSTEDIHGPNNNNNNNNERMSIIVTYSPRTARSRYKNVSHVECLGPNERRNSSTFKRRRNTCSDVDDCTSSGKLFQTAGAAAAKARSPMVAHWVRRPTSAEVVADRSRCCEPTSDTRSRSSVRYGTRRCVY